MYIEVLLQSSTLSYFEVNLATGNLNLSTYVLSIPDTLMYLQFTRTLKYYFKVVATLK